MNKIAFIISLIVLLSTLLLAEAGDDPRSFKADRIRELLLETSQHDGDPRLSIAEFERIFGKYDRIEKVKVLFGGDELVYELSDKRQLQVLQVDKYVAYAGVVVSETKWILVWK